MIIRYPSSCRFTADFLPSSVPPFLLFNSVVSFFANAAEPEISRTDEFTYPAYPSPLRLCALLFHSVPQFIRHPI